MPEAAMRLRSLLRWSAVMIGVGLGAVPSPGHADCNAIQLALAGFAADVQCVVSADLTTNNANTTPQDNSRPGLPLFAFTPRTDAQAVSPDAPFRTAIAGPVPGLQVTGGMADDPDARWVLRLPNQWNGRLVVGVPGGFRSEFMGDYIFSDFVVQQGSAYVSTNKGMLNFFVTDPVTDPVACRLSPPPAATSILFTHFYLNDPRDTLREWFRSTLEATDVAKMSATARYGRNPDRTYLFGISNGGHVVRRLLAESPGHYDGGIDWEGVYWAPPGPNILIDLPVALRNWPSYRDSGLSRTSPGYEAMLAAGYPPDIFASSPPLPPNTFSPLLNSLWETHLNNYWEVTTCVFAQELDPLYGEEWEDYDYPARRKPYHLSPRVGQISTDGNIARPLITLHGTMDALLPLTRHARPFRQAVVGAGKASLHRLYEVQNGNHIERYRQSCCNFTHLEFIQPHAHRAFQLLVDWVERSIAPPAGQCVPRGGQIVANPSATGRPEHCAAHLAE
jgi:hypothetical protein